MTRRFWGGLMVFSLVLTGFSGYFLWVKLEEKQTKVVPLVKPEPKELHDPIQEYPVTEKAGDDLMVRKVGVQKGDEASPEGSADVQETQAEAPNEKKEPSQAKKNAESELRNILFTIHSRNAKEVAIIGDFNEWYRTALTKKPGGKWEVAIQMPPGEYGYMYVIDGRRMRDPNNKKTTEDGKSLLKLKPIGQ